MLATEFKDIKLNEENRSFAKAIDEYNYIRITKPLMDLERELKYLKKELKPKEREWT